METMPESEMKKLAWDIHAGKIFTDRHIRKGDERLLPTIFMPILFMETDQRKKMFDAGLFYEYYNEAGPRGVNGYPIFMSFKSVNKEDTVTVFRHIREIENLKKEFDVGESRVDDITKG